MKSSTKDFVEESNLQHSYDGENFIEAGIKILDSRI